MKKIIAIFLTLFMVIGITIPAFAETSELITTPVAGNETYLNADIQPRTDGFYSYETSKRYLRQENGAGRLGTSTGPNKHDTTLIFNYKTALQLNVNLSFTNTVKGSFFNLAEVSSAVGVTVGVSIQHSITKQLNVAVPAGDTAQIWYRPVYDVYEVTQKKYYTIDGVKRLVGTTTGTVEVFSDWELYER